MAPFLNISLIHTDRLRAVAAGISQNQLTVFPFASSASKYNQE